MISGWSLRKINMPIWTAIFVLFAYISLCYGLTESENLRIPYNAKKTKTETKFLAGAEYSFSYFTCASSRDTLKNFYREELKKLGWQEIDLKQEAVKLHNDTIDKALGQFHDYKMLFLKDGRMLNITFVPEAVVSDGETKYVIAFPLQRFGSINNTLENVPEVTIPKSFISSYPGAQPISFKDLNGQLVAVYRSADKPDAILAYYKKLLLSQGWKEAPLGGECKACKDKELNADRAGVTRFIKNDSEVCQVMAFARKSSSVLTQLIPEQTMVVISYENKK